MDAMFIKKTLSTPEVELNPSEGFLRIEGRSIPEDPGEYFEIIFQSLEDYFKNPVQLTKINIKLEYINSGSSKFMLELLRIVKRHHEDGSTCEVNWYYEEDDESILELGQNYRNTLDIPFNLVEYN